MSDDDRLRDLLRTALPPVADRQPSRDLWPKVVGRLREPAGRVWFDVGVAAATVAAALFFRDWLWLLAYHL